MCYKVLSWSQSNSTSTTNKNKSTNSLCFIQKSLFSIHELWSFYESLSTPLRISSKECLTANNTWMWLVKLPVSHPETCIRLLWISSLIHFLPKHPQILSSGPALLCALTSPMTSCPSPQTLLQDQRSEGKTLSWKKKTPCQTHGRPSQYMQ